MLFSILSLFSLSEFSQDKETITHFYSSGRVNSEILLWRISCILVIRHGNEDEGIVFDSRFDFKRTGSFSCFEVSNCILVVQLCLYGFIRDGVICTSYTE